MTTSEGLTAKEEGMALALTRDGIDQWKEEFVAWVAALPWGTRLTSEDVIDAIGLPSGEVGTNANNAVGAMMNGLAKRGLIVKAGRALSRRSSSHGAELTMWMRPTTHQPVDAAEEDPDDARAAYGGHLHAQGYREGRTDAANAIGQHLNAMLASIHDQQRTHHDGCWRQHSGCALRAVRKVTIAMANDPT